MAQPWALLRTAYKLGGTEVHPKEGIAGMPPRWSSKAHCYCVKADEASPATDAAEGASGCDDD